MPQQYPSFEASGDPRELGRQHGEQASEQIRGYLDFLAESLQVSREHLRQRALRFHHLFEFLCPDLLIEATGLAEGARLPLADALVSQLRGELSQVNDGACTTFAIEASGTATKSTFAGQTSDNPGRTGTIWLCPETSSDEEARGPDVDLCGMLGYHGINEHGVSQFANALGGGPGWKFALSHYPLKRRILEQRTVGEVLQLMREFSVCSNGNYMLADGSGAILDIELTSAGPLVLERQSRFLVHSNHYQCSEHACQANWQHSPLDSFPRLDRMRTLIEQKFGSISLPDVRQFLSDHDGYPVGICRHPHVGPGGPMLESSGKTVAALIAEPEYRRLHVALGNPCENPFITYSL